MKRILVLANAIGGLYSFRRELMQELIENSFEVIIVAPKHEKMSLFIQMGCKCIETPVNRRGTNPISDSKLLLRYIKIIKGIKPNVVLTYTIKPNVYGGFACRLLNVPYIANITGLGTAIENKGVIQSLALFMYRNALKKAECIFFQNKENRSFFEKNNITNTKNRLIPGSGVNLDKHTFEKYPEDDRTIKFLFIGRMMRAKGIDELLKAAQKVKEEFSNVQFDLVGPSEEDYIDLLNEFEENKLVKYHGLQNDVHSYIKDSHATINPSYHEGMSNVLLESASTGRPVLASNIPGCRETFDEDVSGLGFEARNADSLVDAIKRFIELPYEEKKRMGIAGRRKMEKEFDRKIVVNAYVDEITRVVSKES